MNNRSRNVDLCRFIAAIIIMTYHLKSYEPFHGWIYVEFFLIITGYYTSKHFDGKNYNNSIKESIIYTLKKYIPFLPYMITTTAIAYILLPIPKLVSGEMSFNTFIYSFAEGFIFDILQVILTFSGHLVGPLWYLSAVFLILPLFSWLTQIHNRYWILIITSMFTLFYYGSVGIIPSLNSPHVYFRTFAGLCLGALIYEVTYIFIDYINKVNIIILTIIEIITFILPFIIIFNCLSLDRLVLFCFTICLAIMLPNLSHTRCMKGNIFTYLGKLSLPIYIVHPLILTIICSCTERFMWSNTTKLFLFYVGTIIISMTAMYLVEHWKWFQIIINKPIKLRD